MPNAINKTKIKLTGNNEAIYVFKALNILVRINNKSFIKGQSE